MGSRKPVIIRITIVLLILMVIFGGTFGFDFIRSYFIKRYFATYQPPPVSVSASVVKLRDWRSTLSAVGSSEAINGVNVNARVSGQVIAIYFKSGQLVKKDQPLVQLDDAIDRQTYKSNLATLTYNRLTYHREAAVYHQTKGVSKSRVDESQANFLKSQADVATSLLNIQYKRVLAPFSGKIGIRLVNLGEYVTAGQALVTLQQLDPLFIDFTLPEQALGKLYLGQAVHLKFDAFPKKNYEGKIIAINSKVEVATRTILVRAQVSNPNNLLLPGLFAHVTVLLPEKKQVVVIPQNAVSYSLYGDFVYVLTPQSTDQKSGA